jgi:hypothetical protein
MLSNIELLALPHRRLRLFPPQKFQLLCCAPAERVSQPCYFA